MALITCPECGNKISSFAEACPHCGRPRATMVVPEERLAGSASRRRRLAVASGNRLSRAGLVFSIFCAVCGTLAYNLSAIEDLYIHLSSRGAAIMIAFTSVFFLIAQPLSICGFFRRIANRGGVSGVAITAFVLSSVGMMMALMSLVELPQKFYI